MCMPQVIQTSSVKLNDHLPLLKLFIDHMGQEA